MSPSSASTFLQHPPPQLVPIQLTKGNYLLWKSLFIPVLKAYDTLNHAKGREQCPPQFLATDKGDGENPVYTNWMRRDQMLLSWINASLSWSLLVGEAREYTGGQALWLKLENHFASAESDLQVVKHRVKHMDRRSHRNMQNYLTEAQKNADALEAAGSPISDDDKLISRIIKGLRPPEYYAPLLASIRNKPRFAFPQ